MTKLYPLIRPVLQALPPEQAHAVTLLGLKAGLGPRAAAADDAVLQTQVWGLDFTNPVGLAAGFDKNAEVVDRMLQTGFGFVEVGSITPRPQTGNPRPRIFRLPAQGALINRLGFNNQGLAAVSERLRSRKQPVSGVVGANLGRNKDSDDPVADYRQGVLALAPFVDYLVINVSSPNTPGLRTLQEPDALQQLILAVRAARDGARLRRPLLVKIAPDLTDRNLRDIAAVAMATGIDGMVISNTTTARPDGLASSSAAAESGGLSGRPLMPAATETLRRMALLTERRLPLIGVGGIASGADAYAKIRAGASLVQLYTALIYGGPALVAEIKRDLAQMLRADGFDSVAKAVGADLGR